MDLHGGGEGWGRDPSTDLAARGREKTPEEGENGGGAGSWELGLGRLGEKRERKEKNRPRNPWARALSACCGVTGRSLCCTGRVR